MASKCSCLCVRAEAAENTEHSQSEIFVVIEQQQQQSMTSSPSDCSEHVPSNSPADQPIPASHGVDQRASDMASSQDPQSCDCCGKRYQSARYLRIHQLSHRGLKPLLCDTCGRGFYSPVNLRRHILLRHEYDTVVVTCHVTHFSWYSFSVPTEGRRLSRPVCY